MATLEVTGGKHEEIDLTDTANADVAGDDWVNTGRERLLVRNDGADPHTVTIERTRTIDGQPAEALEVEVPAGGLVLLRRLPKADYNDDEGSVSVTYDAVEETGPVQVLFVKLIKG